METEKGNEKITLDKLEGMSLEDIYKWCQNKESSNHLEILAEIETNEHNERVNGGLVDLLATVIFGTLLGLIFSLDNLSNGTKIISIIFMLIVLLFYVIIRHVFLICLKKNNKKIAFIKKYFELNQEQSN